jgi:hypothetical protein
VSIGELVTAGGPNWSSPEPEALRTRDGKEMATTGFYQKGFPDPNNPAAKALTRIIGKKETKEYQTEGSPVDLVLYFNKDCPLDMQEINEALQDALKSWPCGPFSRIWLYDTWRELSRLVSV